MQVVDHHSISALEEATRDESRKNRFLRIRAVILALQGQTAVEVGKALGVGRRTVQSWVARYNAEGLAGLEDRSGRGRPCRLNDEQIEAFRTRLEAGPTAEDGACTLRGPEIRRLLEREFGVRYSPAAVYFLLHRLGYEPLEPRPRHAAADPEAQAEFKKKSSTSSTA